MARLTKYQKNEIISNALKSSKPVLDLIKLIQETSPKVLEEATKVLDQKKAQAALTSHKLAEKDLSNLQGVTARREVPYSKVTHVAVNSTIYRLNELATYEVPYSERNLSSFLASGQWAKQLIDLDLSLLAPSNYCRFTEDSPVGVLVLDFYKQYSAINKEFVEIESMVTAAVNSVTTVNKLLEVWPEAKDIIPPEIFTSQSKQLAVPTRKLNAALNLPK